jgi:signal peptidase I
MGDNRDNCIDSRIPIDQGVGFVPQENLIGRLKWVLRTGMFPDSD